MWRGGKASGPRVAQRHRGGLGARLRALPSTLQPHCTLHRAGNAAQNAPQADCAANAPRFTPRTGAPVRPTSASICAQVPVASSPACLVSVVPRCTWSASNAGSNAESRFVASALRWIAVSRSNWCATLKFVFDRRVSESVDRPRTGRIAFTIVGATRPQSRKPVSLAKRPRAERHESAQRLLAGHDLDRRPQALAGLLSSLRRLAC